MAENKTSFLLYRDIIHTVEKLADEKAGLLFKHILRYVNDLNPSTDDMLLELVFEPIKQSLKRDLKKYEHKCLKNKENIEKRWNKKNTTEYDGIGTNTNHTDSDSDSDSDSDKEINNKLVLEQQKNDQKKKLSEAIASANQRQKDFFDSLIPFTERFGKSLIREFYDYWSEKNKSQTKMKFELEKTWDTNLRLNTWERRSKINKTEQKQTIKLNTPTKW